MNSLNRAQIIGNLTRDPELRTTASGQSVVNFGVATNRSYTDSSGQKQEQVEYHNVVAWGKLADIIAQYMSKGRKIYIEGRLQTREWEAQDGQKRRTTEIVAENMLMLGGRGGGQGSEAGSFNSAQPATTPAPTPAPVDEIQVEDIPF